MLANLDQNLQDNQNKAVQAGGGTLPFTAPNQSTQSNTFNNTLNIAQLQAQGQQQQQTAAAYGKLQMQSAAPDNTSIGQSGNQPPANMGQGYLKGLNLTPQGTVVPGQTIGPATGTLQQQAQQRAQNQPNGWVPPPGYMQGSQAVDVSKMPGRYQQAYAEGQIEGTKLHLLENRDARDDETQMWKRQEVTKQQQISQGMQQAALQGGYGGVVDYLRVADPERAMKIQEEKEKLDQDMLQSKHMTTLTDNEQKAALFQNYALLGKMGATILSAPAEAREGLYQTMLPLAQTIVPNIPTNLAGATGTLLLGAGQAMPDSAHWAAADSANQWQSEAGKLAHDREKAIKLYGADSPIVQGITRDQQDAWSKSQLMQNQVTELATKNRQSQLEQVKTEQGISSKINTDTTTLQKDYDNRSKDYVQFDEIRSKIHAVKQQLDANPNDSVAQASLGPLVASLYGIKLRSPQAWGSVTATDSKADDLLNTLKSTVDKGGIQHFSPQQVGRLTNMVDLMSPEIDKQQNSLNGFYRQQITDYNGRQPKGPDDTPDKYHMNPDHFAWHTPPNQGGSINSGRVPTQQEIDNEYLNQLSLIQQGKGNGYSPQELLKIKQGEYQKYGYH